MADRNYLKTEAVLLAEKTPKKAVVVTPPLREDSLTVTQNGTYQAPLGRGYTDVNVNVEGGASLPLWVTLTQNQNDAYYTADKTNAEILTAIDNKRVVNIVYDETIILLNLARTIDPLAGDSRLKASIPSVGFIQTFSDNYDNTTWEIVEDSNIYWVNLTWDETLGNYVASKTNEEILGALTTHRIPYLAFKLIGVSAYANFEFISPISLAGTDGENNLSLFQSQAYVNETILSLYSDKNLPISTNTTWHLSDVSIVTPAQLYEAVYLGIGITQQNTSSSNAFECSMSASQIITYCGSAGGYRIPYITITYYNESDAIYTRNLEICSDGTLHIIYYDTQKTTMCKLTHLPTDGDIVWTRSVL